MWLRVCLLRVLRACPAVMKDLLFTFEIALGSLSCLPTLQPSLAGSLGCPSFSVRSLVFGNWIFPWLKFLPPQVVSQIPHPLHLSHNFGDHATGPSLYPDSHQTVPVRVPSFSCKIPNHHSTALMRQCPSCSTFNLGPIELLPVDLCMNVWVFCIINDVLGF